MIVYIIIAADVLAGHEGAPGLVCDLLAASPRGWCGNRPLAAAVVAVGAMAPLITPKRLASTAITSWIGLVAVGVWAAVTLALAVAAAVRGQAHALRWLPDLEAFSGGSAQVGAGGGTGRHALLCVQPGVGRGLCWRAAARACLSFLLLLPGAHPACLAVQVATQIVAVIPILATAYTCQVCCLC